MIENWITQAEENCGERFKEINKIVEMNQKKVLDAFIKIGLAIVILIRRLVMDMMI